MNRKLTEFGFYYPVRHKYLTIQDIKTLYEVRKMEKKEMPKLDVTKYIGTKAEIVKAEVQEQRFGTVILLETNPIDLKDGDTLPDGKVLRGSLILGLQKDEMGFFYIGTGSKLDKFMTSHKVSAKSIPDNIKTGDLLKAFEGLPVTLQKSKTGYLEIA